MATSVRTSISAMSSWGSFTPKTCSKNQTACHYVYHTTEVRPIAHLMPKMVAMTMPLSCRVSAVSAFCRPTTQTPSITNRLVTIVHTKPIMANFVPKLVAINVPQVLNTSGSHLIHDSLGPSQPTTETASRSVQPFCTDDRMQSVTILYNGTPLSLPKRDAPFSLSKIASSHGVSGPHLIHGSLGPPKSSTQTALRSVQPFCRAH